MLTSNLNSYGDHNSNPKRGNVIVMTETKQATFSLMSVNAYYGAKKKKKSRTLA